MATAAAPANKGRGEEDTDEDKAIHQWRIKKLIQRLEDARGAGTSMISLIIPPKDQIARYGKMLADEFGTASNIKNRVNRLSVLTAITSTQQKLKLYNKVPPNGLVIYCGTVLTEDGKEKKVNIDFEPHKPVNTSLYLCDSRFHTEPLNELLESDQKFGFIIMDGNGCLYGTLSGNTRTILYKFAVDLPKKHGRGGQSALRFARLRLEKRHNYMRKVAELSVTYFINPTDSRPNVSGLILGGLADFKTELSQSDMFDQRLQKIVVKIVDTSYGFENGFNQAIDLAKETLKNVKFIQEKNLICQFFSEIAQDTGKYCFGVRDCLFALDSSAVHTLIVFESLDTIRVLTSFNGVDKVLYISPSQENNSALFKDPESGQDYDIKEKVPLIEWFAENYKNYGCSLQFVTDKSQEGSQFVKGFGGIGALLRYTLDLQTLDQEDIAAEKVGIQDVSEEEDDYDYFY
jgi:peptide chain release factor subunit 1